MAYPIKNTGYYHDVADKVVSDQDWAAATDRDYKVRGRHSKAYYKQADRWLRGEVDAFRLEGENPVTAAVRRAEAQAAREAMMGLAGEVEA